MAFPRLAADVLAGAHRCILVMPGLLSHRSRLFGDDKFGTLLRPVSLARPVVVRLGTMPPTQGSQKPEFRKMPLQLTQISARRAGHD